MACDAVIMPNVLKTVPASGNAGMIWVLEIFKYVLRYLHDMGMKMAKEMALYVAKYGSRPNFWTSFLRFGGCDMYMWLPANMIQLPSAKDVVLFIFVVLRKSFLQLVCQ